MSISWEIEYNGYTIGSDNTNGMVIQNLYGLGNAPGRVSQIDLVGADGGVTYQRKKAIRRILAEVELSVDSLTDYLVRRQEVVDYFDFDYSGDLTVRLYEAGALILERKIGAKVVDLPDFQEVPGDYATSTFRIEFNCDNINFESTSAKSTNIYLAVGSGFDFPFDFPFDFGFTSSNKKTLINSGNAAALPTYRINAGGGLQNPTITNQTSGVSFTINRTLSSGEYVSITKDNQRIYVLLNGATDIYSDLIGNFPLVGVGTNVFAFTAANSDAGANVLVTWRDTYKGI